MKKKSQFWIYLLLIGIFLVLKTSCTKEEDNPTNGKTTAVVNQNLVYGSMTDQDGNVYKTITIGSQTWMVENLRTTKYRNGEVIPEVADGIEWFSLSSGAYCNYNNTKNNDTIATFGRLYNWFAANDSRNIAPTGWHVPTYDEWMLLSNYLVDSVAANKLKESGTIHWKKPNLGATNETGFTALGGGYRQGNANRFEYLNMGIEGGWWTVTEGDSTLNNAYHVTMGIGYSFLGGCNCPKVSGYSIRFVKD